MPMAIRELAEMFLTNPETVTVSPTSSTAETWNNMSTLLKKPKKKFIISLNQESRPV
jgi:ATP-dependent RNA helicase RhlE